MHKPDVMRVTFDQSPHMKEVTSRLKPGDKITFEVQATFKADDLEGADFTIEAVVPEGYEIEPESAEPPNIGGLSASDAMMTPTSMMVRKRKANK